LERRKKRVVVGTFTHANIQLMPRLSLSHFLAVLVSIAWSGIACGQSTEASPKTTPAKTATTELETVIAAARERAKLLHEVYSTTLDVIHHHYFRREGAVLPARAMEDVFEEMAKTTGADACWISVNTKPMSINHEPTSSFEKTAAAELSTGKAEYERVGKRVYQRAAPIPLGTNCVGCHTKMFDNPPKTPRFAALVISIPISAAKK